MGFPASGWAVQIRKSDAFQSLIGIYGFSGGEPLMDIRVLLGFNP